MMPISIRALSPEAFVAWVAEARTKFSDAAPPPGVRRRRRRAMIG